VGVPRDLIVLFRSNKYINISEPAAGAKQNQKSVKTVPRARGGLKSALPQQTSRKCSASRLFAIVSKLFTLGIYIGRGLGTVGFGASRYHAAFWLVLRRLQRRGCAFSCAAPTNAV